MKSLKQFMLIASLVAIPGLSFAQSQSITQPANDATTAPAVSTHDTHNSQSAAQYQQPSRGGSSYRESSGYGTQAAGSSQSSPRLATPFAGKDSTIFRH